MPPKLSTNNLPSEILEKIFSNLNTLSEFHTISLTTHHWRQTLLNTQDTFWKNILTKNPPFSLTIIDCDSFDHSEYNNEHRDMDPGYSVASKHVVYEFGNEFFAYWDDGDDIEDDYGDNDVYVFKEKITYLECGVALFRSQFGSVFGMGGDDVGYFDFFVDMSLLYEVARYVKDVFFYSETDASVCPFILRMPDCDVTIENCAKAMNMHPNLVDNLTDAYSQYEHNVLNIDDFDPDNSTDEEKEKQQIFLDDWMNKYAPNFVSFYPVKNDVILNPFPLVFLGRRKGSENVIGFISAYVWT